MATFCNVLPSLLLIILFVTHDCRGEDKVTTYHKNDAIVAAIKGTSETLGCFSETIHQNTEVVKDLRSLPDMMSQVKKEMRQQSKTIDSVKQYIAALQKADTCTQEVADLKKQLQVNNQMVKQLTNSNAELNTKVVKNDKKVQDLDDRLQESQQLAQKLENTIKQLNETVTHENKQYDKCTGRQSHQQQQKINELVRAYSNNNNWDTLKRGLEAVLDHSSEVYKQLHTRDSFFPLWSMSYHNNRELATLLLCAGLPVNTADSLNRTMLHGAAHEGHMQLAVLLLIHGADVNFKDVHETTPLMDAVYGVQLEMVRLLVQDGADTTGRNQDGRTALGIARYWGRPSIISYLEQFPH